MLGKQARRTLKSIPLQRSIRNTSRPNPFLCTQRFIASQRPQGAGNLPRQSERALITLNATNTNPLYRSNRQNAVTKLQFLIHTNLMSYYESSMTLHKP